MKTSIPLHAAFFQGVLSVEQTPDGFKPWRLPHTKRHWFNSPDDGLLFRASCPSGVRLRLETDATALTLQFKPLDLAGPPIPNGHWFDAVIDNHIVQTIRCQGGDAAETEVVFDSIGSGLRTLELWLPVACPVTITGLLTTGASVARPAPDLRPLWVTWGSSLTHCVRALSAAQTWPAILARRHNLNLLNLGYGGQCYLDPAVALLIRDLPAQYISLKLGINAAISSNVNNRTYTAMVSAAIAIIREKHPTTPLALVSPIGYPPLETTPNAAGYTVSAMRHDMARVHRLFVEAGDTHLYYMDGLNVFSVDEIKQFTADQCHPNPQGIPLMAEHFDHHVMPLLLRKKS